MSGQDMTPVRWEGGPHDGLVQRFMWDGRELPEWRTCDSLSMTTEQRELSRV